MFPESSTFLKKFVEHVNVVPTRTRAYVRVPAYDVNRLDAHEILNSVSLTSGMTPKRVWQPGSGEPTVPSAGMKIPADVQ
jgi:hypothetical protein